MRYSSTLYHFIKFPVSAVIVHVGIIMIKVCSQKIFLECPVEMFRQGHRAMTKTVMMMKNVERVAVKNRHLFTEGTQRPCS